MSRIIHDAPRGPTLRVGQSLTVSRPLSLTCMSATMRHVNAEHSRPVSDCWAHDTRRFEPQVGMDATDTTTLAGSPSIAVLIPCRNEAATIATVVSDFAHALPTARIFVYDNNSTDQTTAEARKAGAI